MKKVICIGSACKDIFFPTDEGGILETPSDLLSQKKISFELGAKYKVEERSEALGGCAANVASGLSKLGIVAGCYSKIGDDESGHWIKGQMEKSGVDTELLETEAGFPSDLSAIIVDKSSAERVIFSNQKVNGTLKIRPEKLEGAEWFFIGDLQGSWEKHLDDIIGIAEKKGIKIANNPRQINLHDNPKKVLEVIAKSQVLFLNKDESAEVLLASEEKYSQEELNDEIFLAKKLKDLGPEAVAVTDGINGAWVYDGKKIFHAEAVRVEAVDSTGAGDSFTSAFLAAYIKGKGIEECARWGIANSSSEVCFYGSIQGLLDEAEIEEKAKNIITKELK